MSLAIETFVENARRYCAWVEAEHHDLLTARQLLLALMQSIPYLVAEGESETDPHTFPRQGIEGWKSNLQRLTDFPFQSYWLVYAPLEINKEEPVGNDIRDDLADIYAELWHGLQALDAGDGQYAIQHWRDSYIYYWGHHASAAIYAIDDCYRQNANH